MRTSLLGLFFLGFLGSISVSASHAQAIQLGPVARTADGRVARMTYAQASAYCRSEGGRLPTIRELALAYNPDGVLQSEPAGVRLEAFSREDGRFDFFYDPSLYRRGSGDETFNWFWSSTRYRYGTDHVYIFDGSWGKIYDYPRLIKESCTVRCIEE